MNAGVLRALLIILVFSATLIPRLLMIGAPPATDEGIYAFNSLMIYLNPPPGNLLPELGTLSLYQALMAWVFSYDINHLVLLRALDALVASIAGFMLYQVTSHESNSKLVGAVIAIIFLISLNDPVFIQYGFKNSIAAASLPLLAAIAIGQRAKGVVTTVWFAAGALVAIAVLLREPFAIFAIAGVLVVYVRAGFRAMCAYLLGGVLMGGLILLLMILMRGGYQNLIQSYADLALTFQQIAYQKHALLQSSVAAFAKNALSVLMLSVVSIYWVLLAGTIKPVYVYIMGFWLLLATAPLLEPLLKNGYPYHYASTMFGLAGLVSLGWRAYLETKTEYSRITIFIIFLAMLFLTPKITKFNGVYTQYTAQLGSKNAPINWPQSIVQQSNYLLIAEYIHTHSQGNPTVAINGSMLGVIPLAKAKPSSPELAHLSYRYIYSNQDKKSLRAEIKACPPEFIMLTNSSPFQDTKVLNKIVKSIPEYRLSTYIPPSKTRHYGSFDAAIYQWTAKSRDCHRNLLERRKLK